jgi:hypothetical protein
VNIDTDLLSGITREFAFDWPFAAERSSACKLLDSATIAPQWRFRRSDRRLRRRQVPMARAEVRRGSDPIAVLPGSAGCVPTTRLQ